MPNDQCDAALSGIACMNKRNVSASVRARLLVRARAERLDFSRVLTRYALERFLYRLGISKHADNFFLKGALLFDLWFDVPLRPTRDIDLLGFGLAEAPHLVAAMEDLCLLEVDDGVHFDENSLQSREIRKEANYAGIRVSLSAYIGQARCSIQIDVGYGDVVTPGPELVEYPVMLKGFPAPRLRAYPKYTVVAEKLESMLSLGMANSRMKDYFDLWVLSKHGDFDGEQLKCAIAATLLRRETQLPVSIPIALTDEFSADSQKNQQWQAFLTKNQLNPNPLARVVEELRLFVMPLLDALNTDQKFNQRWHADDGWKKS